MMEQEQLYDLEATILLTGSGICFSLANPFLALIVGFILFGMFLIALSGIECGDKEGRSK